MTRKETLLKIVDLLNEVNCLQQEVIDGDRCQDVHYQLEDLIDEFSTLAEAE